MIKASIGFKVTGDASGIERALRNLERKRVLVGVPEDKAARPGKINNAMLAYIHDNGSPLKGIPPRPFLQPGIKDATEQISAHMKAAGTAALGGDTDTLDRELNATGLIASSSVKNKINEGDFTPLKPATLAARKRRGHTSTKPLVETGQLRNAINYVVESK